MTSLWFLSGLRFEGNSEEKLCTQSLKFGSIISEMANQSLQIEGSISENLKAKSSYINRLLGRENYACLTFTALVIPKWLNLLFISYLVNCNVYIQSYMFLLLIGKLLVIKLAWISYRLELFCILRMNKRKTIPHHYAIISQI